MQRGFHRARRHHVEAQATTAPLHRLLPSVAGDRVLGTGVGDLWLVQLIGQGERPRLVAGQHGLDHRLAVVCMGRGHRADDQRRTLLAARQRSGQAIEQRGDAEVVDRDYHRRRQGDADAGAAHQAVEHAVAAREHGLDRRLAAFGGGQVGDHLGVGAVDADHLVAGGAQGGAHGGADARCGTADSCDWHGDSP
ncbi:hypothetical protein D3C81_1598960 [compost metagenome]